MKILIIDDNDARTIQQNLCEFGVEAEFLIAESGEAGIEMIKVTVPDIVITDRQMPGLTGEDVIAFVKQNFPSLHIVLKSKSFGIEKIAEELGVPGYCWAYGTADLIKKMGL
jgi:YesN/AraC family two-component response regulator